MMVRSISLLAISSFGSPFFGPLVDPVTWVLGGGLFYNLNIDRTVCIFNTSNEPSVRTWKISDKLLKLCIYII